MSREVQQHVGTSQPSAEITIAKYHHLLYLVTNNASVQSIVNLWSLITNIRSHSMEPIHLPRERLLSPPTLIGHHHLSVLPNDPLSFGRHRKINRLLDSFGCLSLVELVRLVQSPVLFIIHFNSTILIGSSHKFVALCWEVKVPLAGHFSF